MSSQGAYYCTPCHVDTYEGGTGQTTCSGTFSNGKRVGCRDASIYQCRRIVKWISYTTCPSHCTDDTWSRGDYCGKSTGDWKHPDRICCRKDNQWLLLEPGSDEIKHADCGDADRSEESNKRYGEEANKRYGEEQTKKAELTQSLEEITKETIRRVQEEANKAETEAGEKRFGEEEHKAKVIIEKQAEENSKRIVEEFVKATRL